MKKLKFLLALWVGKIIVVLTKILSKERGTNVPGVYAFKISKDFISNFSNVDYNKVIFVTGTNGKSTTNNMIVHCMRSAGKTVATNLEGANLITGIATAMIKYSSLLGKMKTEYMVFETDKRYLQYIYKLLPAKNICITNIQKDQVQRNGEPDYIYKKIKNEIHNENYIIQKLYPIYNSLYKNEYDITFDDENEFKLLIETINDKEKIVEKDDFIDINSSILNINININKFVNSTNDDELAFKVLDEINSNIISYKKYLSINDVLDILIYSRKYIDIINEVKKQQALKEKERILNGCFEEEKEINNNLLDYSNITNGYDFEAFVANVYKMLGYNVEGVTSKSGDQGADVIIEKDNIKYAIQVKYYNNPVGNKAVQEIVAAKSFYKTDKAMVVTNSTFTPQAITLANANDVLLVDGNKLDKLINQVKNNN